MSRALLFTLAAGLAAAVGLAHTNPALAAADSSGCKAIDAQAAGYEKLNRIRSGGTSPILSRLALPRLDQAA